MEALCPNLQLDDSWVQSGAPYTRHRPEESLLYQLIERQYPAFHAHLARSGRTLPRFVRREFEEYLKCGRLEFGFLRVRCTECHAEKLVAFSCKRRGFCPSCGARRMAESAGQCGAVTLMQRFGSALNLNVHSPTALPWVPSKAARP